MNTPVAWGWAIFGLGRAAEARSRALEAHSGAQVRWRVSRRSGVGNGTFAEMLADPDTHCVAICSENADHSTRVETCLRAGKHVLVEYPLAHTASEVRHLVELASAQHRILHLGLLGLLTAQHGAIDSLLEKAPVYGIEVCLEGGFAGWVAVEGRAGRYGQLAISRLHALWDWVGPLSIHRAQCRRTLSGYDLKVVFRDQQNRLHRLTERRAVGTKRQKTITLVDPRGQPIPVDAPSGVGGVFVRDVSLFHRRLEGAQPRVSDETIIDVASLAEAVSLRVGTPC